MGGAARHILTIVLAALAGLTLQASPAFAGGIVGNGPGTCTEAALNTALMGGGSVTFNCGPGPTTIPLTTTKVINSPTNPTSIDGAGGQISLSGGGPGGTHQVLFSVNSGSTLSVSNLSLSDLVLTDFNHPDGATIVSSGVLSVSRVTFSNNTNQNGQGAGILLTGSGASATISDSTFAGNLAGFGAAIAGQGAHLSVNNSTFSQNSASGGGGAINFHGDVTLQNDTFSNNSTLSFGGAMQLTPVVNSSIDKSTFIQNSAGPGPQSVNGGGGALSVGSGGPLLVSNSTFYANNTFGFGGAVEITGSPVTVANSTIASNTAFGGGAVSMVAGSLVLTNSTIALNSATSQGGAVWAPAAVPTPVRFFNSVLANNLAGVSQACWRPTTSPAQFQSLGYNLDGDGSCQLSAATDLTKVDAKLGPIQDNGGPTLTLVPAMTSPVIDAGAPMSPEPVLGLTCLPTDQRGVTRPVGSACDMGAVEVQKSTLTVTVSGPGTVSSTPAGLNCASAGTSTATKLHASAAIPGCSINVSPGTALLLTATPNAGAAFVGWSGACTGTAPCTVTLNADQAVTATFKLVNVQLLPQPQRLVDTRSSGGPIQTGQSRCFALAGQGGVPADAGAVVLNVTAVGYSTQGWLTVFPLGQSVPPTSTLNFDTTEYAMANGAVVGFSGGQICVNVGTVGSAPGSAQVILDATGYLPAAALTQMPMFTTPQRIVDTRSGGGAIATQTSRCFAVGGQAGIPQDASAVLLNVTAVGYGTQGWLTVYPMGQPLPGTSTLNFDTSEYAMANGTIMPLGTNGQVCVSVGTVGNAAGSAHVVLDATGYINAAGQSLVSMLQSPQRVADTRTGGGPVATGTSRCFAMTNVDGIPQSAVGVVVNVTAVGYGVQGWLTAYPDGQNVPSTSTLNFDTSEYAMANGAIVALGSDGKLCVSVGTVGGAPGGAHVVLDVVGYLRN